MEFADPDRRRYPHAIPNDPLYVNQWYEQNAQPAAIDAVTAWDTATGRNDIVIADLDTGIRYDHPDLGAAAGNRLLPVSSDPTILNCHVPASANDLQNECNCTTQTCGAAMANAPGAVMAALRPIAAVIVPQTVSAGQNVSLAGTGSAAACGHTVTAYAWTNVTDPTNPIQNANTATAIVVAPARRLPWCRRPQR